MEEIKHIEELDYRVKQEQIINLIKREFQNEISKRQDEVHQIQKNLLKAKKSLHLLKYVVIKSFYDNKDLNIINKDEFLIKSNTNTEKQVAELQNRIHPAVKKIIGKKPVDFNLPLMRYRERPQNNQPYEIFEEQDVKPENHIISTLNTNQLVKTNKSSVNEENVPRGNQKKTKHEIIVGNISKYSPSNNAQDVLSHKWMIYVRGPRNNPDISHIVKKIRFFLHPSYQPNDVIEIEESPFHLSRRGWGEFPVRVQIHFQNSFNKPIDIIHDLKLDQTRSGRQTLGNETKLNVWLYTNTNVQEEDEEFHSIKRIKQEVIDNPETETINDKIYRNTPVLDIHSQPSCSKNYNHIPETETLKNDKHLNTTVLDIYSQPGCSKNYIDPETNLQENEINIIHNESGLQVIKKEPAIAADIEPYAGNSSSKNGMNYEDDSEDAESDNDTRYRDPDVVYDEDRTYLFDHCYTDEIIHDIDNFLSVTQKYYINIPVHRFNSTRQIVYFLFKSLPLVTDLAQDLKYTCCYPYVAESLEEFASWNIGKQRSSEWYRAKEIKEQLILHNIPDQKSWSIKFILMFGRAYAFTPFADYSIFQIKKESVKTIPNQVPDHLKVTSTFTEFIPISQLMENKYVHKNKSVENCIVDVENFDEPAQVQENYHKHKNESSETNTTLNPLCTYIKRCAEEIDIVLEDEEIIPNVLCNSAEKVILKAVMCLAEELIRSAWANKVITNKGRNLDQEIERDDIYRVLLEREEFDIFTNDGLGKNMNV